MSKLKEYKEIPIEEIKEVDEFKTFIPENNMYDKIKEDIAKNGIKVPLIVNQNYELINGYTRLKIARELGIKKVPVAVYETTDRADEYDLLVSTNLTQRQLSKAQALALIEKAVEEKTKILKKNQNSENNPKETKVERPGVQLSATESKKIQNLTDLRNAVKEELKKYNVKVDDRALDYYIRIKENAPWLTDYILKGKIGIKPAYSIYTKLQEMGLLEAVAKLPPYERNTLLTDGRKIILDERKDLLEEIVNHRMAVSQAINKLKTEEKLKRTKGSKPRTKEDLEEEEELEEEAESTEGEDSESDEEYDLVGEWKKANEEEEKEEEAKQQLTPQFNTEVHSPAEEITRINHEKWLQTVAKLKEEMLSNCPEIKQLYEEKKLDEEAILTMVEVWRNFQIAFKNLSINWHNVAEPLLSSHLNRQQLEELFYKFVKGNMRLYPKEEFGVVK
ncbi:ParB N-terminal domain-containing protein [Saccharolobus islandicus]|uniref:ParB domain protein nuclease n=1 Tax=Saccharolobus islandicus (strain L.D.8.5 / Lassen \|nr:ParB N-terminal domain-containing protein [Sulfolobus islandicus]ADB88729.1 ParB domain protein nuclease [Sulfolobus islandicus L.D.8.5]